MVKKVGKMKKSLILKTAIVLAASSAFASTASASCGNGSLYCNASSQGSSYAMSSHQSSYMPFTSSASLSGPISMNGLGANEFLQPTSCPVNVNALESGQTVLGCYNVAKRTPRVTYSAPQYVQVVRPIIYVRYPVPTPVQVVRPVVQVPVPVPVPVYQPRPQPMPMCGMPMMPQPPMQRGCGW